MLSNSNIAYVDELSSDEFRTEFVSKCRPVVVRGAAKNWQALQSWSPAFLAERFGTMEVPLRRTPLDETELSVEKVHQGFFPMSDLLKQCADESGDEVYIPGVAFKSVPVLFDDIEDLRFLSATPLRAVSGFFGRNTRCLGHMHPFSQAVLTQVVGSKEVVLYSPEDLNKLYLHPWWRDGFFQSRINFHALEAERFPLLQDARASVVRLEPGDALFIPVHWLHVPVGVGFSASVTHWWRSAPTEWGGLRPAVRSIVGAA
ncbi:MAG: cupin-like domain-containing protein, partial [Myxococcota bacterium]